PQPSRKAREMTLAFVPGGPEAITNGLRSFRPSTVVARVGMGTDSGRSLRLILAEHDEQVASSRGVTQLEATVKGEVEFHPARTQVGAQDGCAPRPETDDRGT